MIFKKKIAVVLSLLMSVGMATDLFSSSLLMANAEETTVMAEEVSICDSANGNGTVDALTVDNNINKKILSDAGVDESEIPDWYNINLSRPAWVGKDAAGFGIGFKMKQFFPNSEDIKKAERTNNSFDDFEDYKCVATIIHRGIETDNWRVYHLMAKNDVDKIRATKSANGIITLNKEDVNKRFLKQCDLKTEKAFGININEFNLTSLDVLYTNIPIIVNDGTTIEPVSSCASESVNDEKQTALKSADRRVRNSSITSNNNVPDWFDIKLSHPAWKGEKAVGIDDRCSSFRFFPSDKEIKNIEKNNNSFYHMENYKCAATIVRNNGSSNSISVRHVFVRKDVEELNAAWSNENKSSFKIKDNKNQAFIGSTYKIKENKQTDFIKKLNALENYSTVGTYDSIYINIPIVFKNDKGETETVIEPYFMYGDLDFDGVRSVADIAIIAAHLKGVNALEGVELKAADVNHDGIVDENDISGVHEHVMVHEAIDDNNIVSETTTASTATTTPITTDTSDADRIDDDETIDEITGDDEIVETISNDVDPIVGKLTIASGDKEFGHSWLVFNSYVDTTLDFSEFTGGKKYNPNVDKYIEEEPGAYYIKKGESVSIDGSTDFNFFCHVFDIGDTEIYSIGDIIVYLDKNMSKLGKYFDNSVVVDVGGIYFNLALATYYTGNNAPYGDSYSYTREITNNQLKALEKYWNDNDYYNLYTHNCSTIAQNSWNLIFPDDKVYANVTPVDFNDYPITSLLIESSAAHYYDFIIDMDLPARLKKSIAEKDGFDPNYNQTMHDILQNYNN